jgi:diguanylate cyclase (GGDEF)-like protein
MSHRAPRGEPTRVLVADPDPVERGRLRSALEAEGFEVEEAGDAGDALERLDTARPDVVLASLWISGPLEGLLQKIDERGAAAVVLGRRGELEAVEAACRAWAADVLIVPEEASLAGLRIRRAVELRAVAHELERARAGLALAQRMARFGSWELDRSGRRLFASEGALRVLALEATPDGVPLERMLERIHAMHRERARAWFEGAACPGAEALEVALILDDGSERAVRHEVVAQDSGTAYGLVLELSERRRGAAPIPLAEEAGPDALVDEPGFLAQIEGAIEAGRGRDGRLAVLCLDLDGLKRIAGTLGQGDAEQLVGAVARRLRETLRASDSVARLGVGLRRIQIARIRGDELGVLLTGLGCPQDAAKVALRVQQILDEPFAIEGRELPLAASLGVAVHPGDAADAGSLLRCAQTAAWCAHQQGANTFQFYTPAMNARAFERLTLETSLRRALERRELELYYQPRVDIRSGRIVGLEALVRWKHPELGMVSPGQFIPLAEETGLIVPIGEWILGEACRQARSWQDAGLPRAQMAVNLSTVQFRRPGLCETVERALASSGLDAEWLELELTESTVMQSAEVAVATLRELKRRGVHISIDDFGTGYSSLSYLRRFPLDALKIDQSFIREVTSDADAAAIATSIILMGRSLKLKVVAEGVETKSQLAWLRAMQCDQGQGYLFSPPVPAAEAEALLAAPVSGASAA